MDRYVIRTRILSPFIFRLVVFSALIMAMLWLASAGNAATTIVVNTTADTKSNDGQCSLREAIIAANRDRKSGSKPGECPAGSGADTIILPPGAYTLTRTDNGNEDACTTGDLDIRGDVDIVGGPGVTIDASGITDRVFHVMSGNVTLSDMTIKNGGGDVNYGGGIYNKGHLTLTNVTLSGNEAEYSGGGIKNIGQLTLYNSTLADNHAGSTGGGVANYGDPVEFQNTIIAGNTAASAADCTGSLSSLGHNLVGDDTGCPVAAADLTVDPADVFVTVLGPLEADSTGTEMHALLRGSPAIDAGDDLACPTADQRGEPRPTDGDRDGKSHCDVGAFEAGRNPLALLTAFPNGEEGTTVTGLYSNLPNADITLNVYSNSVCDPSGQGEFFFSLPVTTDENGYFTADGPAAPEGHFFLTATATAGEHTTDFSPCIAVGPDNDSWPRAYSLDHLFASTAVFEQYVDAPGQSRWFKLTVEPDSKVIVTLTDLPANYDLTLYKDIQATFDALVAPQDETDLARLGAEFAPDAFSPDAFSPDAFSPDAFSPDAFSPDAFSPDAFSPDAFSPDAFSPDAFSPDAFSPDAFSPDAFSPDAFSPDAFSPDAFSPDAFSPDAFSPDAFSGAQTRSLLAVSAFEGTAGEGIALNTWNNTGEFYVRVRGRNGVSSLDGPFHLEVTLLTGSCSAVGPITTPPSLVASAGDYKTIILADLGRMAPADTTDLEARLAALAARPEVAGVLVDVGTDARVAAANAQADAYPTCPYAKNLAAEAIKAIVDDYWALNPLEYVVIAGGDQAIPFYRHPDNALLANEQNFYPPVLDNTPSQASLRLGYVLGQDFYAARHNLSLNNSTFPLPELAVGRLVETPDQINLVLDAYLGGSGVVIPQTSLVTGYDFLEDVANAVRNELEGGIGSAPEALITPANLPPTHPDAWTADQLRAALLGSRHDMVFLAGHFSANSALAADYSTRLLAEELPAAPVDLENAIIYSAGCHAGYNIVDEHGVPAVTRQPDWAQAFALKGATLIGGTGYQYGDTDFIEYSERLYLGFTRQLRLGSGPVSIGQALAAAKQAYLAETPQLGGLHEKALLEATIFGLPMLSVDLPGRITLPGDDPTVPPPTPFDTDPGLTLGLEYADISVASPLSEIEAPLTNIAMTETVTATYLVGNDGFVTNPGAPALPLEVENVTVAGTALRGVGFRGGLYTEEDTLPLIGAPTTEIRGVHAPFLSDVFFPVRLWSVNYLDALGGGATRLMATPAQHKTGPVVDDLQLSTRRQFSQMSFRLYYSANTATYAADSVPALAAPPSIVHVSAFPTAGQVLFRINVVGNPAAGIQEVWVAYTDEGAPWPRTWESLDLTQHPTDSTLWEGTLALNDTDPQDLRYMVQAVNGVGLVGLATNLGAFYIPGFDAEPTLPTTIAFLSPPTSGPYGTQVTFSALLTGDSGPLAGQTLTFRLGSQTRLAVTGPDGVATVELSLLGLPGDDEVRATFDGTAEYLPSVAAAPFTIEKQATALALDPPSATVAPGEDAGMAATLTDVTGRRLGEKTLFFVVTGGESSFALGVIGDYAGRAPLGIVPLPPGTYDVTVFFGGEPLGPGVVTLEDSRYLPSTTTGSLTVSNTPPAAVDDAYSVDQNDVLVVPAPGVLDNDSDADHHALTAVLVDEPEHGSLTLNTDGSFTYIPDPGFYGADSFAYQANDGFDDSNLATVNITVNPTNQPPICSTAVPDPVIIWPPNNKFKPVHILGVTDPDGDPVTIVVDQIFQDEEIGKKPDACRIGASKAWVRAERDGYGNGRVYHIRFTASDGQGGVCTGEVLVGVPHDQGDPFPVDDGPPWYDSVTGEPIE